jgi:hypothetical protein
VEAETSAQEAKLVPVEYDTLPDSAKKAAEKFVSGDRFAWELFGSTGGQRGGIIKILGKQVKGFTLPSVDDKHYLICKSADKEKVEEVVPRIFSHVPLTAEQRSKGIRDRCVDKTVWIPGLGIVRVFGNFTARKNATRFKGKSVLFPDGKSPFYFKRWREEEDVELPDPATWVVLFELQACRWFLHCCRTFLEETDVLLGEIKWYSVLKDFAPRSGMPQEVYIARNKADKSFLSQEVGNALLALLGYNVHQTQLSNSTKIGDIAKAFKPPSNDEDFDLPAAIQTIKDSLLQRSVREAAETEARRAAAAAVLAGTATQNSFGALQEEDVGSSSASISTQDPKEFPTLGAQTPKTQGAWAKRSNPSK